MIAYHIRKRIERAYSNNEKFRVFVFIPLLPGFAGEPESSGTLQIILKHTYAGICRNHGVSIIEQLQNKVGDKWKDYIGFYSLRGHDLVNNVPVTELIYIHSKLMIVDDTSVILGSANINDRSMLGTRDSEFAVLINESKKLQSKMDGKDFKAANFAYTFRVNLFAEHLGLDPKNPILADPLSDDFLKLLQNTASTNTNIYRQIWGCYPDDQYRSFKDLKEHKTPTTKEELDQLRNVYEKNKKGIVGHAVEFPLHFLENENLGISFFSVENIVPERNFT
jgi:phospholipase D1/2